MTAGPVSRFALRRALGWMNGCRRELEARAAAIDSLPKRSVATAVIVGAHLLILAWFNIQTIDPVYRPSFIVDVTLGTGGAGGAAAEPTPNPVKSASAAKTVPTETTPAPENAEDAAAPPDPPTTVTSVETLAAPPVEPEPSQDDPSEAADAVLAMVEAITGVTGAEAAEPVLMSETPAVDQAGAQAGDGGGCDIGQSLAVRLTEDPALRLALSSMPQGSRSVANAIQVWDGDWITPADPLAAPALAAVRAAILETLEAAPPACRSQPVLGPRFAIVADPERPATILVVGSGSWRWSDLEGRRPFGFLPWFGRRDR